jgi:uncharacterized protein (DUF1501 family)
MERREFINLTALSTLSLFIKDFNFKYVKAEENTKYLVLVELKGGNDSLNTVIPFTDSKYYELRPNISIERNKIIQLSENIGLNPSLEPLHKLWKNKELAIIQGLGYPNPNRSHFRSIDIWDTASDSEEIISDGWYSRAISKNKDLKNTIDGIIIGQNNTEGPLSGINLNSLTVENISQLINQTKNIKNIALETKNKSLAHILKVQQDTNISVKEIESKMTKQDLFKTSFPKNKLGQHFKLASQLITNKIPVSVIKISLGGFDTHTNQKDAQGKLLAELGESLSAFSNAMKETNNWNNVLVMTYSEFGRRVAENGNNGTDHGTASTHFMLGGKVKGSLFGKQPSLEDLDNGDLKFNVDYRSLYNTILTKWYGKSNNFLSDYKVIDCIKT